MTDQAPSSTMTDRAPSNTLSGPNAFALATWIKTNSEELQPLGFGGILAEALERFDFTITYSNIRTACTAAELVPDKPVKVKVDPVEELVELKRTVASLVTSLQQVQEEGRLMRRTIVQINTAQDLSLENTYADWRKLLQIAKFQDRPTAEELVSH